jgi:hypothetical protein
MDLFAGMRISQHRGHVVAFAGTNQAQKLPKRLVLDEWISERDVRMDPIDVAASAPATVHISSSLEITQDAVGITLRNAGGRGDLPYPKIRLLSDRKENLGVVRYEGPPMERGPTGLLRARTRFRHHTYTG